MPIFIGAAILDLSKYLMYDFFYNTVMKAYQNAKLIYTDTDSFIIEIPDTVKGLSQFVLDNKDQFDLSGCLNDELPLYKHLAEQKKSMSKEAFEIYCNDAIPGKFKNETYWFSIEEFVGLRPKQYSYTLEDRSIPIIERTNKENKEQYEKEVEAEKSKPWNERKKITKKKDLKIKNSKAKGLTGAAQKSLKHQNYVDQVLKDDQAMFCKMQSIQSKNFTTNTYYIYKKALVNYENKRYWLDSIYSLPFGHPWINKIEEGTMKVQEVVDKIKGNDKYDYELNEATIEKKDSLRKYFSATNLNKDQLKDIAMKCSFQDYRYLLSDPNGILKFKEFHQREISDDGFY
jgi:hypothetical protein